MVNIWKIGAWPGYPGIRISSSNKKKFIKEALRKNYVAIGWRKCTAKNKSEKEIRKKCKECNSCNSKTINEFVNFTIKINSDDIILFSPLSNTSIFPPLKKIG